MRILSSQVVLSAEQSRALSVDTQTEGRVWVDSAVARDSVQISEAARTRLTSASLETIATQAQGRTLVSAAQQRNSAPQQFDVANMMTRQLTAHDHGPPANAPTKDSSDIDEVSDDELLGTTNGTQMIVLKRLVEAMTGQKLRVVHAKDLQGKGPDAADSGGEVPATANEEKAPDNGRVGWGVELDVKTVRTETNRSDFTAEGNLVTEDGRTMAFSASFLKESQSISVESMSLREGDAKLKDPLVLLYSGTSAELSAKSVAFDLDNNGTLDNVPGLANGAYVVADRNHDGKVNDASELLGALSNDGFADLRALDEDGNGFVDSGDANYKNLYLWDPLAAPQAQLTSLAEANVGALFTGQVASPLDIRSDTGSLQGRVRATGIYVTEGGEVRPMEQLDLVQNGDGAPKASPVDIKA